MDTKEIESVLAELKGSVQQTNQLMRRLMDLLPETSVEEAEKQLMGVFESHDKGMKKGEIFKVLGRDMENDITYLQAWNNLARERVIKNTSPFRWKLV